MFAYDHNHVAVLVCGRFGRVIHSCCGPAPDLSSKPAGAAAAVDRPDRQTDGRTDGRTLGRFMTLTAYDADRVIITMKSCSSARSRYQSDSRLFLLFPGSPGRAAGFTRTRIEAAAAVTLLIIARSRETLNAVRLISASTRSKAGRINSFRAVCLRQPPQRISRQSGVKFAAFHRPRTGGGDNY